jgi:hypothetical protein
MQSPPSNNAGTVIPEVSPHDPPLDAHKYTYTLIGYTERRRQMQSPPSNDAGTVILEVSPYDEKKANGYINERNHKLGKVESGARLNAMRVDSESREWDLEAGQTRGLVASSRKEALEEGRFRVPESEYWRAKDEAGANHEAFDKKWRDKKKAREKFFAMNGNGTVRMVFGSAE